MPMHAHTAVPGSALDGVLWPAVPGAAGARMLALQYQFAQSERWSAATLRAAQFAQLTQLLRHARATVPFYRDRLAPLPADRPLDAATFARMPLLQRGDIQEHFAAMVSRTVPPDHGHVQEGQTSGSTGRPIRFMTTGLTETFWHAFTLREHLWQGRDFAGKLAAIRSRVTPGAGTGWGASTDAVFRTGAAVMCNTERPIAEQAQWLMHENPDYLISVASNVQELARHCTQRGLRPPRLREVRTYGEALHPDARSIIRAAWAVPVIDMYSCREAGYLALQCPQHEHYHVQAEGVYLELINAAGAHCAPGELGRVVITPLHNFAMPLLRYDIGDYAEAGEPCDCGRGLPVIRRILGRVRNMLRLPDGGMRHPRFGEAQFGGIAPVRQFQVVQKSLRDIEVALVVARPLMPVEEEALRTLILKNLGHPFTVSFVYRDDIPRAASGKYEDFRSEVVV
ncbi:MAG: phenylacetate--CoA ligase family protein [Betaproteobacteria bacterium]|nr:MAG: phenylacetate--CoA ligase family protein [Betaproteobacteria bacterium]